MRRSFSDIATERFTSLLRPTPSLTVPVYLIVAIVMSFLLFFGPDAVLLCMHIKRTEMMCLFVVISG